VKKWELALVVREKGASTRASFESPQGDCGLQNECGCQQAPCHHTSSSGMRILAEA